MLPATDNTTVTMDALEKPYHPAWNLILWLLPKMPFFFPDFIQHYLGQALASYLRTTPEDTARKPLIKQPPPPLESTNSQRGQQKETTTVLVYTHNVDGRDLKRQILSDPEIIFMATQEASRNSPQSLLDKGNKYVRQTHSRFSLAGFKAKQLFHFEKASRETSILRETKVEIYTKKTNDQQKTNDQPTITHANCFNATVVNPFKGAIVSYVKKNERKLALVTMHLSSDTDEHRAQEAHAIFSQLFKKPSKEGLPINYPAIKDLAQDNAIFAGDVNTRDVLRDGKPQDPILHKHPSTSILRALISFNRNHINTYGGNDAEPSKPQVDKKKTNADGLPCCKEGMLDRIGMLIGDAPNCEVHDKEGSDHSAVSATISVAHTNEETRVKAWVKKLIEIACFDDSKNIDSNMTDLKNVVDSLDFNDPHDKQKLELIYDFYLHLADYKFTAYTLACSHQQEDKDASSQIIRCLNELAILGGEKMPKIMDQNNSAQQATRELSEFKRRCKITIQQASPPSLQFKMSFRKKLQSFFDRFCEFVRSYKSRSVKSKLHHVTRTSIFTSGHHTSKPRPSSNTPIPHLH